MSFGRSTELAHCSHWALHNHELLPPSSNLSEKSCGKISKNISIKKLSCEHGGPFTLMSGKTSNSGELHQLKEDAKAKTKGINKEQTQSQKLNWKCLVK